MATMSLLLGGYWQHQKATWTVCIACFGAYSTYWANCSEHSQPWAQLQVGGWFLKPDTYSTDACHCYRVFLVLYYSWDLTSCNLLPRHYKPLCYWAPRGFTYVFSLQQPQNPCQSRSRSNSTSGSFPHLPGNIIWDYCHKETDGYQF